MTSRAAFRFKAEMLISKRFNPHHAPAGSPEGGQFVSDGGGISSGDKGGDKGKLKSVGKVPRGGADLRWKSEDTIKGSLVIEVPDDIDVSSIDDSDIRDFIKAQLPGQIGSIDSGDDIEAISITKKQTGKGYIKVDLDITPTTKAGEHWLDTGDATGQWSTYHGGRSMNTVQEIWERVKTAFAPAIEKRAEPESESEGELVELSEQEIKLINALFLVLDLGLISSDVLPQARDEHTYHTAKMKKCLKHLEAQGADPGKAHRICYAALGEEANRAITRILPTQTQSLTITRDAQGNPRWLMIAASAVVNKVGAIDSTTLFDNFIRHVAETNEYPVLDFFHEGERIRFGVADWLKRDGALYLASGSFDDTDLARGAAEGLESQPDYWGGSIAYRVTEAPLMLIVEGEIPVYQNGVNNFISIVPKRLAANLFTATLVAEEVRRMNEVTYSELVKLIGEERAKQFADQVDDANRTITETGMITRAEETPPAEIASITIAGSTTITPEVTVTPVPPAQARQDNSQPLYDVPAVNAPTLDDIVTKLNDLTFRLEALEKNYDGMKETGIRSMEEQKRATSEVNALGERLAAVEASKERWDTWLNDAPEYVKAGADKIYRARDQEPVPMTMGQLAKENVSKLNRGPHERHGS